MNKPWDRSTEALESEYMKLNSLESMKKTMMEVGDIQFDDYFKDLLKKKGIKTSELERRVSISRSYLYAILNGSKKPERKTVIRLAVAIGAELVETNRMLKFAGFSELYAKSSEDVIIMFGIRTKKSAEDIDSLLEENGFEPFLY